MRDDFAILILTHGRANNLVTLDMLRRIGYSGRWYLVIDDEDDQEKFYKQNFGADRVIKFCKQNVYNRIDTMDNFNEHRAIVYARNESFRIARELGLTYFMMFDDDYEGIYFRYKDDDKLKATSLKRYSFEKSITALIDFLDASGADAVAYAQGGDLLGGINGGNFNKGLIRKAMNSFVCRADREIDFRGTMNEDVTTYTTLGSRGHLFFTFTHICIIQKSTQTLDGGMTEVYKEDGTYIKSFYSVMSMPSCVSVAMMNSANKRIHHKIDWEHCVPKIIDEKYRKDFE